MASPHRRLATTTGLVLVLALLAGRPAIGAPLDTHQLLRFHLVVHDIVDGSTTDQELVLFRDGEVLDRTEVEGTARYRRGRMAAEALAELRQALASDRVGQLRANGCKMPSGPASSDFRGTLTWFGKGNRTTHLEVNDHEATAEVCAEGVVRLFLAAIAAFADVAPSRGAPGGGTVVPRLKPPAARLPLVCAS